MRSASLGILMTTQTFTASCGDHHEAHEAQFICDGTEDSFAPGTSKTSAMLGLQMEIVRAIPEIHTVQNNELIARFHNADDEALAELTLEVIPFTAKHDHGTPIQTLVESTGTLGEYRFYELNYVHRGPWKVTVNLSNTNYSDTFEWVFCIAELSDAG